MKLIFCSNKAFCKSFSAKQRFKKASLLEIPVQNFVVFR